MLPKFGLQRLRFPKYKQREFVEKVFNKSHLDTESLSKIAGLSPRTIRDWKRERYCISKYAVDVFCKQFNIEHPQNIQKLINNWRKERLMASTKGGYAHFKMYGNPATLGGCKKGGSKTLKILRERGIIARCKNFSLPSHKTSTLAEFIGIMLGDGSLSKFQAAITLNTLADKSYIKYVTKLGIKLFKDKPTVTNKNDCNATDIRFSGIKLVKYFVRLGLKIGDKVKNQVGVPNWILDSQLYSISCLRGLMDTDGCIAKSTHKWKLKTYVYRNQCFANRSKPLLKFVENTLINTGLHPCVAGERIWLYNKMEVQKYFELVGSHNYRLLRFRRMTQTAKRAVR
jgi:hypothetical protein